MGNNQGICLYLFRRKMYRNSIDKLMCFVWTRLSLHNDTVECLTVLYAIRFMLGVKWLCCMVLVVYVYVFLVCVCVCVGMDSVERDCLYRRHLKIPRGQQQRQHIRLTFFSHQIGTSYINRSLCVFRDSRRIK